MLPLLLSWAQIYALLIFACTYPAAESFAPSPKEETIPHASRHARHCNHGGTSPLHSTATDEATPSVMARSTQNSHTCTFCEATFASKNALFRHLRRDECQKHLQKEEQLVTARLALLVGYDCDHTPIDFTKGGTSQPCPMETSRCGMQKAVEHALRMQYNSTQVKITSISQSSVAKQRPPALGQEPFCSAAGDVLIVNYKAPLGSSDNPRGDTEKAVARANEHLSHACNRPSGVEAAQILSFKTLKAESSIHAEGDCTQRTYHYLLPLSWFSGGEEVATWWLETQMNGNAHTANNVKDGQSIGMDFSSPPPNPTLSLIKRALRTVECPPYLNRKVRRRMRKEIDEEASNDELKSLDKLSHMRRPVTSRDGLTAQRERRPWHNFGEASPNHQLCWKTLDRARLAGIVGHKGEVTLVVEFRADNFLQHQIRRIIGSVVAIANGWLPEDFIETATQPSVFVETPLAPPGRLYLSGVRFQGKSKIIQWQQTPVNWTDQLRKRMLDRLSDKDAVDKERRWLSQLHDLSPSMKQTIQGPATEILSIRTSVPPTREYNTVLELLRRIVSSKTWPSTSSARSRVIKEKEIDATGSSGSFTVINPGFEGGHLMSCSRIDVPQANILFPELTEAIFHLETALTLSMGSGSANKSLRPPSSHCAVNSRAQFVPHLDSGRGAGQSLSMIVGLGEYGGGDLMIEGDHYDIRYNPLEFDGHTQRHWTSPFAGERFSLVWFTPKID